MMFKRSTSTPVRPAVPVIEEPITRYKQPLLPGPTSPSILPFNLGSTIVNPTDGSAYQLIQPLGNGSYAVVYMVREKNTGNFYALKCLSKANLSDYHLEIQHNEVRIHEKLSHPNIVKLDHYFETSDWLFLVLEYCEGQDLYYWLTQNNDSKNPITGRSLSEKERLETVKQVFIQILDAVGYCHKRGVAHRDLKPENFIVMIKNDSVQVKLTDFGLATDEKESIDFDCGSKPYMSYECRNPVHDTYNPRLADIWSLGIILLNLLYHRSPWADPNPEECEPFTMFQLDKSGFLMEKFSNMPKNVAQFFASSVFCDAEESRIGIKEWKDWCDKLVERMLDEEIELEDVFDNISQELKESSSPFAQRHDRQQSWSDVVGEFESENETDYNSKHDNHSSSKNSLQNTNLIETDTKEEEQEERKDETKFDKKDDYEENHAINSDADSGFGTDEEKERIETTAITNGNNNSAKNLSVSPPRIIYCKPKPWGDGSRGHQRENSVEYGSNISNMANNNNHWSSYNQRRERLEQRRKEKQEQTLNSLAYRRRGSINTDTNDSFTHNRQFVDHTAVRNRKPQQLSDSDQESIYTAPPRRNPPRKKSSQSIDLHLTSSPPKASQPTYFPSVSPNSAKLQRSSKSYDKTPKKVGKSAKNHLSKMLAGVVMFNRSVKVGGQIENDY